MSGDPLTAMAWERDRMERSEIINCSGLKRRNLTRADLRIVRIRLRSGPLASTTTYDIRTKIKTPPRERRFDVEVTMSMV